MATSFSCGRSRRTRREPPTMGKQLVSFITCGCESSAPFLAHLAQRAMWAFVITLHPSLSAAASSASVNFSYFHLLLWNHWTDLDQTWQKCSLGGPLPGPIMCSDWLKLWRSSCQKLLSQWKCNIIEMMTGWSSTRIVIFVPIGNPRWQPQGDLI